MKVALVVPQDPPGVNNFHQVPIGALHTAAQLRSQGVEVSFFDLRIDRQDDPKVFPEIAQAHVVVVCSTDYDLAQCYPSLAPTTACVRQIKEAGDALVVCAGSHATADPELTRAYVGCDAVVVGEFEFAVPELVRHVQEGERCPERWPVKQTRLATEEELATLGTPAYDLALMDRYFSEGFVDGQLNRVNSGLVLANRGCPFGCDFCYLFFGRRLRRRPVESTLAELKTMHDDYGIRHFFFLDYTFTIDDAWARALSSGIQELGLKISWICQTRVDCLNGATLQLMKEAGCAGIWLGIESPDLEQRRYLGKGRITFGEIEDAVALIRSHGMNVLAFVMVGLPNETESSLASLNAWLDRSQVYYSLSIFQRRLGTPLAEEGDGAAVARHGWDYLDVESECLGESQLRRADLREFFEFHQNSSTRVANVMRQRKAASAGASQ
jgi:anaerobic magnesium-protoporphyrin IX monomethyl ester cyclase